MSELFRESFVSVAEDAGLLPAEAHTLYTLSSQVPQHYTYRQLWEIDNRLAQVYPHVRFDNIGESASQRPIGALAIGNPTPHGRNMYVQGPGHALEVASSTSSSIFSQLLAQHPAILKRFGYDGALFCSHIDPDGLELQQPLNFIDPSLRQRVRGGWRGSWRQQVAWGYPTSDYTRPTPEVEASLHVLRTYRPRYMGAPHGSWLDAHIISSRNNRRMAAALTAVLKGFGLPINPNEPDDPRTPVLAPGVFGAMTKDTLVKAFESTPAADPGSSPAANRPEETEKYIGGTTPLEYLPDHALLLTPEIPMGDSSASPDISPTLTRLDALEHRTAHALQLIGRLAYSMEELEPWLQQPKQDHTVAALAEAACWWRDVVPTILQSELADARYRAKNQGPEFISPQKYLQLIATPLCSTAVYLGNARRLAEMAGNQQLANTIDGAVDGSLQHFNTVRPIPLVKQVGAGVLTLLVGMRHAGLA